MSFSTKIAFAAIALAFTLFSVDTIDAGCRSGRSATGSPARRPNYNFSSAGFRSTSRNAANYHRATPAYRNPVQHVPTVRSAPQFTNTPTQPVLPPRQIITQPTPQPTAIQPVTPVSPSTLQPTGVQPQPVQQQPELISPSSTAPENAADAALQALLG